MSLSVSSSIHICICACLSIHICICVCLSVCRVSCREARAEKGDYLHPTTHGSATSVSMNLNAATRCNAVLILPPTAVLRESTHCNTLQHPPHPTTHGSAASMSVNQHTTTYCNTLQHTATHSSSHHLLQCCVNQRTATHCNTLLILPRTAVPHR